MKGKEREKKKMMGDRSREKEKNKERAKKKYYGTNISAQKIDKMNENKKKKLQHQPKSKIKKSKIYILHTYRIFFFSIVIWSIHCSLMIRRFVSS